MPGTVVKPKTYGTAVAWNTDVDDPLRTFIVALSLISKDFTGGVVIVEVGLKKLSPSHQVHFLHETHWDIEIIQQS